MWTPLLIIQVFHFSTNLLSPKYSKNTCHDLGPCQRQATNNSLVQCWKNDKEHINHILGPWTKSKFPLHKSKKVVKSVDYASDILNSIAPFLISLVLKNTNTKPQLRPILEAQNTNHIIHNTPNSKHIKVNMKKHWGYFGLLKSGTLTNTLPSILPLFPTHSDRLGLPPTRSLSQPKFSASKFQWPTIPHSYSHQVCPALFLFLLSRIYLRKLSGKFEMFGWKIRRVDRPVHRVEDMGDNEGRQGARRDSEGIWCLRQHGSGRRHWIVWLPPLILLHSCSMKP